MSGAIANRNTTESSPQPSHAGILYNKNEQPEEFQDAIALLQRAVTAYTDRNVNYELAKKEFGHARIGGMVQRGEISRDDLLLLIANNSLPSDSITTEDFGDVDADLAFEVYEEFFSKDPSLFDSATEFVRLGE